MKKNNLTVICIVLSLFITSTFAFVKTVSAEDQLLDEEGNFIDSVTNSVTGEEISVNDYKEILNQIEHDEFPSMDVGYIRTLATDEQVVVIDDDNINENITIPAINSSGGPAPNLLPDPSGTKAVSNYTKFVRESKSSYYGTSKRSSKYLANCGSASATKSASASRTENWSANIGLTGKEIASIKPNLGFTYNRTATYTDTNTIGVKKGHIGWFEFTPRKNKAVGKLRYYNDGFFYKQKNLTFRDPIKDAKTKELDGVDAAKSRAMTASEKKKFCGK
ncbi:hypothetical protein [Peribacillus sp. NPDC096540]|uniref:hypothetical protein n=1 Tax=Peribacillus sp. NPDC096540 TaxID=3390612 RepID=UPI003CFCBD48